MEYNEVKRGENSKVNELSNSQENNYSNEYNKAKESFTSSEYSSLEPSVGKKTKKGDKKQNAKLISSYLTTTAVTLTVATTMVILPIVSGGQLRFSSEDISYNGYECVLQAESGVLYQATLQTGDGELVEIYNVETEENGCIVNFYDLVPETDYSLTITDEDGEEQFSKDFTTEPVLEVAAKADGNYSITMHGDVSLQNDISIRMYDAQGKDFSSNVVFEDYSQITLYTEGLYSNDYMLEITIYGQDLESAYSKNITLNGLTQPEYFIDKQADFIVLNYLSGDLGQYNQFDIVVSNENGYYPISSQAVTVTDTTITVSLTTSIPAGVYDISLWGTMQAGNNSFINEIWKGQVTFN